MLKKIFPKLFLFCFLYLNTEFVFAQSSSLDEDFLESLPPSVKDELELQNEIKEESDLEQLFQSDTSQKTNKYILEKLKSQLEELENRLDNTNQNENNLTRFGSEIFSSLQSTFTPINVPVVPSEYFLGFGDKLSVSFYGQLSENYELFINRDGTLTVPEFGKISLNNKTLDEARNEIRKLINESAIGVNVELDLIEMREIQVAVLGRAKNPGIYTVSANSNILSILNIAGGISDSGSFRSIALMRDGKLISKYDLYDIFVFGKLPLNMRVRSGDVILVDPVKKLIPVTGGVNLPAIYEIKDGESLQDLLKFAGDLSDSFKGFNYVEVKRYSVDKYQITKVQKDNFNNYIINSRDSVLVPYYQSDPIFLEEVTISGMVNKPGKYFIQDGETLTDLINKAGGYKEGAYEFGISLFRESALNTEREFAELNYAEAVNYIVSSLGRPGVNIGPQALDFVVEELRSRRSKGRLVMDYDFLAAQQNQALDIELIHGDQIYVPKLERVVYLVGEFHNPANHTFNPSSSIKDYVHASGGMKEDAYENLIVIDPDGSSSLYKTKFFANNDNTIYPGSVIYAPRDIGQLDGISYASAVAPILSSLALSLASLNSISD